LSWNFIKINFSVTNVQKDIDVQRKSLRQINDRVVSLEKIMIDSHILLEKIRATIQQDDKSLPESQKFIHILSRESPYIYTNEPRFPVTEKYIPWKVKITHFKLCVFLKEKYKFRLHLIYTMQQ
jgi:hypothetical protein